MFVIHRVNAKYHPQPLPDAYPFSSAKSVAHQIQRRNIGDSHCIECVESSKQPPPPPPPRPPGDQLCAHMWSGGDKRVKAAILEDSCGLHKWGDVPENGTQSLCV